MMTNDDGHPPNCKMVEQYSLMDDKNITKLRMNISSDKFDYPGYILVKSINL